jgi:hypothetical protein
MYILNLKTLKANVLRYKLLVVFNKNSLNSMLENINLYKSDFLILVKHELEELINLDLTFNKNDKL